MEKFGIRVLVLESLGEDRDSSCMDTTMCLRGLVFLSQISDQLGGRFFNGELGLGLFSTENDIVEREVLCLVVLLFLALAIAFLNLQESF